MCHSVGEWTKYLSAFEQGMIVIYLKNVFHQKIVGAKRTGLCQELQRCWVFLAQQFLEGIKNGPANLTQLWETL
jgi:hypothetical protein